MDNLPVWKHFPELIKKKNPATGDRFNSVSSQKGRVKMLFNRNFKKPAVEIEELGKNKDNFSYKIVREKEGKLIYRQIHKPDLAAAKMLHIVIYNNSVYSSGS